MSNYEKVLDTVSEDPRVKSLGIRREKLEEIVRVYNKAVVDTMISSGFIDIEDYYRVEIVRTQARVHVLRGKEYKSTRSYKLRTHMHDSMYEYVDDAYSLLE